MDLFQRFLNTVQSGYRQADKNLGGWLPGGGTASPLTRAKQEGERQMAGRFNEMLNRQSAANDYVGKPGRYANKSGLEQAIRATTQAGVNPLGIFAGSSETINKLGNYYKNNPEAANEFSIAGNMFLRYLSGAGAEGMKISPEEGKLLYDVTQRQINDLQNNPAYKKDVQKFYENQYGSGINKLFDEGQLPIMTHVPALYNNQADRMKLNLSVGRFWAQPQGENIVIPNERYNFSYGPQAEEKDTELKSISSAPGLNFGLVDSPNELVRRGYGQPFSYSAVITPQGNVQFTPR